MKIGIYFTPHKEQGGVFQYSLELIRALQNYSDYKVIVFSTSKDFPDQYRNNANTKIVSLSSSSLISFVRLRRLISNIISIIPKRIFKIAEKIHILDLTIPIYKILLSKSIRIIKKSKVDLMIYPTVTVLSTVVDNTAFVAIHDLQHKINPRFKEASAGGRKEYRDWVINKNLKKSNIILIDSLTGKEDFMKLYNYDSEKIVVLPYIPPSYLDVSITLSKSKQICSLLGLPRKFMFYPAKFWPHKNHENIIKAINILKKQGKSMNIVFTGAKEADFSTYNKIMELVNKYGLNKQVFYLGYVNNVNISAIYKVASGLIFPTFFGPSNIPILEAWIMGIPVITSNIRGCRDQLADAGLLVDPRNPLDISVSMWNIYSNKILADKLIKKGKARVNKWTRKEFTKTIRENVEKVKKI